SNRLGPAGAMVSDRRTRPGERRRPAHSDDQRTGGDVSSLQAARDKEHAVVWLLATTGMRVSELCKSRWRVLRLDEVTGGIALHIESLEAATRATWKWCRNCSRCWRACTAPSSSAIATIARWSATTTPAFTAAPASIGCCS